VTIVNAFVFIGLDLVARDKLHDTWRRRGLWWKMALLIAAGSLLSYWLNRDAGPIALASCVAFGAAAIVDGLTYHWLRNRAWMVRANGSNVLAAAVDSILFPTIAFGALMPVIVLGQFVAKVFGGLLWSYLIAVYDTARQAARYPVA
jgi:uncharacterized PurR-regulated membrane protein YhhQ (DUF165 family)